MAFTIIPDWWAALSNRVGGDSTLSAYAPGDDSARHSRVDEAADYATKTIANALARQYTADSIAAFGATSADAEMRYHALSLALYALTSHGGGRAASIEADNTNALGWLAKVRGGQHEVPNLVKIGSAVGVGTGNAGAAGRTRLLSGGNCDYSYRNPKI